MREDSGGTKMVDNGKRKKKMKQGEKMKVIRKDESEGKGDKMVDRNEEQVIKVQYVAGFYPCLG